MGMSDNHPPIISLDDELAAIRQSCEQELLRLPRTQGFEELLERNKFRTCAPLEPSHHKEQKDATDSLSDLRDSFSLAREIASIEAEALAQKNPPPQLSRSKARRSPNLRWFFAAAILLLGWLSFDTLRPNLGSPKGGLRSQIAELIARISPSKHRLAPPQTTKKEAAKLSSPPLQEVHELPKARARSSDRSAAPLPVQPRAKRAKQPPPRKPAPEPSLAKLDALAQNAWKAGKLSKADQLFAKIISRAPHSKWAQLAWGDRFLLAKQRGLPQKRRSLWHAYLRSFPRGKFSQDARAGLCQTQSTTAKACWQKFLTDFPKHAPPPEAMKWISSP